MSVTLHTSLGDLPFVLHCRSCPRAAYNFLALAASGYYNETVLHRNVPGFIVQGGDPTGTGKGGCSVYSRFRRSAANPDVPSAEDSPQLSRSADSYFADEGFGETFHNRRGVLSMAHRGAKPNTNASQFFICYAPQPSFDGVYTAFGELVEGDGVGSVLSRIEAAHNAEPSSADVPVRILSCTVTSNPFASMEVPFDPRSV